MSGVSVSPLGSVENFWSRSPPDFLDIISFVEDIETFPVSCQTNENVAGQAKQNSNGNNVTTQTKEILNSSNPSKICNRVSDPETEVEPTKKKPNPFQTAKDQYIKEVLVLFTFRICFHS